MYLFVKLDIFSCEVKALLLSTVCVFQCGGMVPQGKLSCSETYQPLAAQMVIRQGDKCPPPLSPAPRWCLPPPPCPSAEEGCVSLSISEWSGTVDSVEPIHTLLRTLRKPPCSSLTRCSNTQPRAQPLRSVPQRRQPSAERSDSTAERYRDR